MHDRVNNRENREIIGKIIGKIGKILRKIGKIILEPNSVSIEGNWLRL